MAAPMPAAAVDTAPPSAVEGFAYPDAAKVLADQHITLKTGDGHITLAECASAVGLIHLFSRQVEQEEVCFKVTGPTGYLALEIPKVYLIRGTEHAIKATVSTDGNATTIDIPKNDWRAVGEAGSSRNATTLLELTATDGPAAPSPSGDFPAVGTVTVDQPGRNPNAKACTATLVDRNWVLTAASCFGDKPAAGAPAAKSTATIGGRTVGIAELAPRTDRDLVMARLATPVNDITPASVGATAPAATENLRAAGYGRTATEWAPLKAHTTTHTVSTLTTTTIDTTPAVGQAPICQGDAGAPLLRDKNGATEIAAVASRSWQGGCLGTPATETRTSATSTRVDDLTDWVRDLRASTAEIKPGMHVQVIGSDRKLWETVADYKAGSWLGSWQPLPSGTLAAVDSVAIGDTVHVFVIGSDGHVYTCDGKVGGSWTPWGEVPGNATGVKDITATARGNVLDLQMIGSDGSLYSTQADYAAGRWDPAWTKISDDRLRAIITSIAENNVVHVIAIDENGKVRNRDADYNAGKWTPWGEVPGNATDVKAITAAARGNVLDLQMIDSNGSLYSTQVDYAAGRWDPAWTKISDDRLTAVTSIAEGNVVHVIATDENGKVRNRDADYNAGRWTPWGEVPGGATGVKAITATTTS
ncbi:trypsin-like serine protease [Kitasatospora sp. NPDC101235]|uniref:trypsin-like serine protease n=1 Tax=Kitasatospora sp. NPDC101235 TaxID=3364101 RepID=UPI003821FDB8